MKRSLLLLFAALLLCVTLCAVTVSAAKTPTEFYEELYENLTAQNEIFTIEFMNDPAEIGVNPTSRYRIDAGVSLALDRMAVTLPKDELALDLAKMNLRELECDYDGKNFLFSAKYLLDRQRLDWTQDRLDELAKELFRDGADDYEIVKSAYTYIATHFTYDETLQKFTDYDGLTTGSMVCQGYALMMTKLLNRAGVPCRIVTGFSNNQRHGWNIVKIDGLWYCVDVTWDAEEDFATWDHFLMCREDFKNHKWDEAFLSETFLASHPLATRSYEVPQIDILIDGTPCAGLTIRKDKQIALTARFSPENRGNVRWNSTNPDAVSVTEEGLLTSVSPGFAYITATTDDESYVEGVLPVTAVDLTSCSPWAEEELNALYLRQLYPAEMCDNFRTGIRRDELAELVYLWMRENGSQPGVVYKPQFEDVNESDYAFAIFYTASRDIFSGTSEKTFSPEKTVTREQAAKVLNRLLELFAYEPEECVFTPPTDAAEISAWAERGVDRVLSTGLMRGRDDGRFDPRGILTREETAIILERLCRLTTDRRAENAA